MTWIDVNDKLPDYNGQRVLVAAWEFGRDPVFITARFWQSSLPGQPPKFYFDDSYNLDCPHNIADEVHYWMPIPDLP